MMKESATTGLAVIETRAAQAPAVCQSWDELSTRVSECWNGVLEGSNAALGNTLALGALIVTFAERPEVAQEAAGAKVKVRGPKFSVYGWVAKQLSERYGEKLPGFGHMRSCAKAALIARQRGIAGGSLHELLGWSRGGYSTSFPPLLKDITPPRLPAPKGSDDEIAATPVNSAAYARLAIKRLRAFKKTVLELVGKKPHGFRWPMPEGREAFLNSVEDINRYLKHLGLELLELR
jgi:hypothetical protein